MLCLEIYLHAHTHTVLYDKDCRISQQHRTQGKTKWTDLFKQWGPKMLLSNMFLM